MNKSKHRILVELLFCGKFYLPSLNMTDFETSGRLFVPPSLLRTPTGTITVGGGGNPPANCCKGGIVEQYSMGLFGLGCLPYNHLSNTPNIHVYFFIQQTQIICIELYNIP